jgi:hypothetical protein
MTRQVMGDEERIVVVGPRFPCLLIHVRGLVRPARHFSLSLDVVRTTPYKALRSAARKNAPPNPVTLAIDFPSAPIERDCQ